MTEPAGEPQRVFGHYEVESVLGRGAMGMVYLARDRRIGRRVALKTVHVDEKFDDDSEANEFYKRLQREAELGGALQHPNIVTLYEPGYEKDVIAWLATEYVDGESLRDRLRKRKPLPLREAMRIGADILRGLSYAHAKGIIHRDIKPANILINLAGEAKIADFGIARPPESNLTAVGEMLGTPSYMSPEQVRTTTVTPRADLFSAGTVIYEMACGVKAFAASDVSSILRNVVEAEPIPAHEVNPEVPESLGKLIARLMEKAPDKRYESAAAALEELQRIRSEIDDTEPEPEEVGTMGGGQVAHSSTHPTAVDFDDHTPALSKPSTLRRPLKKATFFGIVVILLLAFAASALVIRAQTDATPTVTYSELQLAEFSQKRQALAAARSLYSSGDYAGSISAYERYLKRYPHAVVAREELAEVREALHASEAEKITVTAKKPKRVTPKPAQTKPPVDERRPWYKRIFGR
jgi:serine/threonine protein kinase